MGGDAIGVRSAPGSGQPPERRSTSGTVRFIETGGSSETNEHNEFIRGPKWRTTTSAGRRRGAAAFTFVLIVSVGVVILLLLVGLLGRAGAPDWVRWLPWSAPTLAVVIWSLARPAPAVLSDDDDDSWTGFAIRYVLVGLDQARPAPVRVLAALLFGAPIVWSFIVLGLLSIAGIF